MTYINPEDVLADVDRAIERQEYEGGSESLCDVLQAVAPESCDYWYEVACELHRRERFYESLDCWREAEKYLSKSDNEPRDWYEDMISTLINASNQSGDAYFKQQALLACDRLIATDECELALNYKLQLILDLHFELNTVLTLIEKIFDGGFALNTDVRPWSLGIKNVDSIDSYSELAKCFLWSDRPADAMRIWSKSIEKNKKDANEQLCSAIFMLNWYADSKGFDDGDFLPEEFGRLVD